jgi:hypothetical protein
MCGHWLAVDGPIVPELKREKKKMKREKKTQVGSAEKKRKQKPKAMQLPVEPPLRAPASQHALQTKMEKLLTQEEKFLTMEELIQRTE